MALRHPGRSSELLAIIVSFVVYKLTTRDGSCNEQRKALLKRRSNAFAGAMMYLGGVFMIALAFMSVSTDKGNVIPGLSL